MKNIILVTILLSTILSCSSNSKTKEPLTDLKKQELISELQDMLQKDQYNRSFLSAGSLDKKLIDSLNELTTENYIAFKQSHKSELSKRQKDSLWNIQNKIDLDNTNRLYEIVVDYGWLSKTQLDSMVDPMVFLFHTPKKTIVKMQDILLKEVQAKRMEPIKYAMYVDNMRKKAFGKHQLYGTGDEYDSKTNTIAPPIIENIDSTNFEREKIGLLALKKGEYRTNK